VPRARFRSNIAETPDHDAFEFQSFADITVHRDAGPSLIIEEGRFHLISPHHGMRLERSDGVYSGYVAKAATGRKLILQNLMALAREVIDGTVLGIEYKLGFEAARDSSSPTVFSTVANRILGNRVWIPYDMASRRRLFGAAFEELEPYVQWHLNRD
jgi:hypothetical protein